MALDFAPRKKNQRFVLQDFVIGIDAAGKQYPALPTASRPTIVVPAFEAKHDGRATVYFTGKAAGVEKFEAIVGKVQIFEQEVDEVLFKPLRKGAKKTKLGEYKITQVEQQGRDVRVAVKAPAPKWLRKELSVPLRQRMRAPGAMKRYHQATLELRLALQVEFLGSDGLWYEPNSAGNGLGQQQMTQSQSFEFTPNGVKKSASGSNQPDDSIERVFGRDKLPVGVKIVGVRARVQGKAKPGKVVEFELKDVSLTGRWAAEE